MEGLLDDKMLDLIETLDIRVYKIRGTDPRADLYRETISEIKKNPNYNTIYNNIRNFIETFMSDHDLESYLKTKMHRNPATKYILWEYEKFLDPSFNDYDDKMFNDLQIEHILPETPSFGFPAFGFSNESEYNEYIHRIGNLTLLEQHINKKVRNLTPSKKSKDYLRSKVRRTRQIGYEIDAQGFSKDSIDKHTLEIIKFCKTRWKY